MMKARQPLRPMSQAGLALILLLSILLSTGATQETNTLQQIDSLHWLAGKWAGEVNGNPFQSVYSSPDGGMILSSSKEFKDNKLIFFEFERFQQRGDSVILVPYPAGKESVEFRLVNWDPAVSTARFENPTHDFPTSITYNAIGADSLSIRVAGPARDGGKRAFVVKLRRVD